MTALSVNLNKVALLRNTRAIGVPSVLHAARLVLEAGADGLTVHPRPDSRHIRATDLARDGARLAPLIGAAQALGCRVSLFMDPDPAAMAGARALGADRVELYTEPYARAHGTADQPPSLQRYRRTAEAALACGLGLNAGHDLNRANLADFLAVVPGVAEVSIGHALIADALEFGLVRTVGLYRAEIQRALRARAGA